MDEKFIRRPAVEAQIRLGRSTIYKLMSEGKFPLPVKLTKKAVAWRQSDIDAWLASRPTAGGLNHDG